jgi:membrane-bound lytic murein transglycosylase MltF
MKMPWPFQKKHDYSPWIMAAILGLSVVPIGAIFADQQAPWNPFSASLSLDPAVFEQEWTGDLDGMIKRGYVRMLVVPTRTTYFVDKGVQHGTAVDFGHLFEDELNQKIAAHHLMLKNLRVQVVFIPMRGDQILPALAEGKGDIAAANITITPERLRLVDFAAASRTGVNEIVVTGPASPNIANLDDLSGKVVFVRKVTSYYQSLLRLNERFEAEGKPLVILKEAPETLADEDLLEMVNAGLVPIIIVDSHIAEFWKQIFPKIVVHSDVAVRVGAQIAWAIRKRTPQLKAELDDFVVHNGRMGTKNGNLILNRYLKSVKYVKDADSEAARQKFETLAKYFQTYGMQYDVDWVLMSAQGYQESQLNQDMKSHAGAIGIMQLLPATGNQMGVGDIRQTEPNINAGIKYMRMMINRYYEHEPMTDMDKALFTFASYNAGPARIAQLRQEAKRRGLNPNVWFGNVEYVAAEKVGSETVTYVSNIYKYYIAYRLSMESKAERQQELAKARTGGG